MSQVLSGNNLDAKLIHTLDSEDADQVGPGAWTLIGGATIEGIAQFGNSLLCDAAGERLIADSAVAGFDQSDTAKTMTHFYWRTPTLSGQQGQITFGKTTGATFKSRVFWDANVRMRAEWVRTADLSPGNSAIDIRSQTGKFSTDVFSAVSVYINAAGISEGKIFKDGVDITLSVAEEAAPTQPATGFDIPRIGNHTNNLDPARFVDHITVIQSSSLSDAKAARLSTEYHDTRGFGYKIIYFSQSPAQAQGGETISLFVAGAGKDVTVKVNGILSPSITRVNEGQIDIVLPTSGLDPGFQVLEITNVESGVTLTVTDEFSVASADDEELIQILRGERGGRSHPICKVIVVDDNGDDLTLDPDVIRKEIVLRRDDRRTEIGRFVPPIQSCDVTFKNDQKQYTNGFGGAFDGILVQGRVVKPFLGVKVKGINDFRKFGTFVIDDVSFENSPPATAKIKCRDLLSAALDQEISLRAFASIRGDLLIAEILAKVGFIIAGANSEISFPATSTTFTSTPVIAKQRGLDILSQVMAGLQPEANYRLIQDVDGIMKLVIVPFTGIATQAFHYRKDVSKPYSQRERANQSSKWTTVARIKDPPVTADAQLNTSVLTEADFTGSPPQKTLTLPKAIRIEWRQPGDLTQDFQVKEVARTPTSLTLELINPLDVGTINVLARGDLTSEVVGEAGSGEDQGGAGLGNAIDRQKLRRGSGRDVVVPFVANDSEAQAVANTLQQRGGDPASEQAFKHPKAPLRSTLNDLIRIIEKFSESRNLHSISQLIFTYQGGGPPGQGDSLTGRIIALDAGIIEPETRYDSGFQYDFGLIYDQRFPIGAKGDEDRTFRGAVVRDL